MKHNVFGKLKYKETVGCWLGRAALPSFAAVGAPTPPEIPTEEQAEQMIADLNESLGDMREQLREKFGAAAEAAFQQLDEELQQYADGEPNDDEELDPLAEEREQRRQAREARRADKLARGLFPFRVGDPEEAGPTPEQIASFQHLQTYESAVLAAVMEQVWESFQEAYADETWRKINGIEPAASPAELKGRFYISRVEITREQRDGFAQLIFPIESDWQDEEGLFVVYSPAEREAISTAFDGLDAALGTAESEDDYVPTPLEELIEAVMAGDEARARALAATGIDINDVEQLETPPLCIATERLEVEEVRRLLAFGADATLADPETGRTPLKIARRIYREMGFAPSKKTDPLRDAVLAMARETNNGQFEEMKSRLEAIIQLLKQSKRAE